MAQSQKISAKQVVADIKAGMSDAGLMKKYSLSPKGLQSVKGKLVQSGILTQAAFQARPAAPARDSSIRPTPPQAPDAAAVKDAAADYGHKAYDLAREAKNNALYAIKSLVTDPLGGQGQALSGLGETKAMYAGAMFIIAFVISVFLLEYLFISRFASAFGRSVRMTAYAEMFLIGVVPASALWAAFFLLAKIFKTQTTPYECVFATGVALIPSTITLLVVLLVGLNNFEIVTVVGFFGASMTVLFLNSAVLDILKLSTRHAVLLTPTIMLVSAYLTKVMYTAFF